MQRQRGSTRDQTHPMYQVQGFGLHYHGIGTIRLVHHVSEMCGHGAVRYKLQSLLGLGDRKRKNQTHHQYSGRHRQRPVFAFVRARQCKWGNGTARRAFVVRTHAIVIYHDDDDFGGARGRISSLSRPQQVFIRCRCGCCNVVVVVFVYFCFVMSVQGDCSSGRSPHIST
jgi:hypothetical protein